MFKKTRLRIFILIILIATVIISLMLSIVYAATSRSSFDRSISLLESYVNEPLNGPNEDKRNFQDRGDISEKVTDTMGEPLDFPHGMMEKHDKMFRLSTFYSVLYDDEGNVLKVNINDGNLYTEQEIVEIANNILLKGELKGKYNRMPFLIRTVKNGTVVALIDNTMEEDNFDKMFKNCLAVGFSSWIIVLILSWFFSNIIIYPLEQNDIKQKQFISDAGHELKTPVSVIGANAEILYAEIGENKWLSNIQYENERMGKLVKQLLELARAENIQQAREHLDFSNLVSGGVLPFESIAYENGHVLNMDIENNIQINGNINQLSQLISILIDNAIRHSTGEGDITVRLYSDKNHAILTVSNPGQSIPVEIRERLFERFYRVDEARTEDNGHYGLGLAIARAVATSHNGKLELDCRDGRVIFKCEIPKI